MTHPPQESPSAGWDGQPQRPVHQDARASAAPAQPYVYDPQPSTGRQTQPDAVRAPLQNPPGSAPPLSGGAGARRWSMPVTYAAMTLCVLIYLWEQLDPALVLQFALVPAYAAQEPWLLLTGAFLHDPDSLAHIGSNMFSLWIFGRMLEPLIGSRLMALVLLGSALCGSAAVCLLEDPYASTIGLSGGIFGLIGAVLILSLRHRQNLRGILVLLALNLAMPLMVPNISWQAHVGGLIGGAVLTAAVVLPVMGARQRRKREARPWPGSSSM